MHPPGVAMTAALATVAVVLAGTGPAGAAPAAATTHPPGVPDLQLVTLTGAGTAGTAERRAELLARQDQVLARLPGVEPVYRWTTALNGFAARLTPGQASAVAADPRVALVEPDDVRRMASTPAVTAVAPQTGTRRGGAGVVVGVIDSGIAADRPVFAEVPGLGRDPRDWRGSCVPGQDWPRSTCNRKLVGAAWFVTGFGSERIGSSESLSAHDSSGHGTQVASLAAGNAGVSVRLPGPAPRSRTFTGVAPQARLAAYKACWTAPDPVDDGCSTADLVSAVDRATADGVDVLTLAVEGPDEPTGPLDTLNRAMLGAAEADVVVVAAAGNDGASSYAAHGVPWVTTVGAATGPLPRLRASLVGGPSFTGVGRTATAGAARVVLASRSAGPGVREAVAAQCRAGSLDQARVAAAVVVCDRGGNGRVDKSAAVAAAGGVGMVLVNAKPGALHADLHSVPTVHLSAPDGAALRAWLRDHHTARIELDRVGSSGSFRVPEWSPVGDPRGLALKPDLVAEAGGVIAPQGRDRWTLVAGTSAATARTSGTAALLRARTGWDAVRVRSGLVTSARPVIAAAGRAGSGRLAPSVPVPRLVLDEGSSAFRAVLEGRAAASALNLPGVLLTAGRRSATRTVTNTGSRAEYFSVRVTGLPQVRVTPLALRLDPGESGTFTVRATSTPTAADSGALVWRGARGSRTRLGVLLSR